MTRHANTNRPPGLRSDHLLEVANKVVTLTVFAVMLWLTGQLVVSLF